MDWGNFFADFKARHTSQNMVLATRKKSCEPDDEEDCRKAELVFLEVVIPVFNSVVEGAKENGFDCIVKSKPLNKTFDSGTQTFINWTVLLVDLPQSKFIEIEYLDSGVFLYKTAGAGTTNPKAVTAREINKRWLELEVAKLFST